MIKVIAPVFVFLSVISFASPTPAPKEQACDPKDARCNQAKAESPFANTGIRQGDVLLSVNGIKLSDSKKGLEAFRALKDSKRTVVRVIRDGKEQTIVQESK